MRLEFKKMKYQNTTLRRKLYKMNHYPKITRARKNKKDNWFFVHVSYWAIQVRRIEMLKILLM